MKIAYGLLCLCFLVLFHEIGHFLAAKLFGVTVESLSIGFGPVLLHRKRGDTDYRLSALPLGGYCGMKGEQDFIRALDAGLSRIEADSDSLYGVSPLRRAGIAFAGPLFNLLFTFMAFTAVSLSGYTYSSYSTRIILADELYPEVRSAARDAGLLTGDRITAVNGTAVVSFSDLVREVAGRPDEDIEIAVERDGRALTFPAHTDTDSESGIGKIGVAADTATVREFEAPRLPLFPAVLKGLRDTGEAVALTVRGIASLFHGADLMRSVSGPAQLVDRLGGTVKAGFADGLRTGFASMLEFMAIISVSLFIMNLLPVPVLDGGLILFAVIEAVTRRRLPPKALYYIQFVGLAFIAVLFIIGFSGDVLYFKNYPGSVPQ